MKTTLILPDKTTLILPDPLMVALKRRAAERGISLSALAAELLRRGLDEKPRAPYEPNFPVFHGTGPALVDVANGDDRHDVLGAEKDARLYGRPFGDATPDDAVLCRRAAPVAVVRPAR